MSKRAKIRVLFNGDLVKPDQNADGVLTLEPAASGVVRFASEREVVFTPSKDLQPGKTYRVSLSPKKLTNLPASLSPYEFEVSVQEPGLEVEVVGLSPSSRALAANTGSAGNTDTGAATTGNTGGRTDTGAASTGNTRGSTDTGAASTGNTLGSTGTGAASTGSTRGSTDTRSANTASAIEAPGSANTRSAPARDTSVKPRAPVATLSLAGTLITSDVEPTKQVEQLVTATYMGRTMPLVWTHGQDALQHTFTISGIERQPGVQPLSIVWNGKAIGASTRGKTEVSVPPRDQFLVTTASVIEDNGQRYIAVRFSDPLNTRQDLRGLVTLSTGKFTTRIDANVLKIFPEVAADGDATVTLQPGIRSANGERLEKLARQTVTFQSTRPQVRFVGEGVILPPSKTISIPFEAVNVRAVRVTAFEINEESIGQFLQVNTLRGNAELGRVGRHLWRKKIPLTAVQPGRWNRYSLDVGELFKQHPHALIQLTLQVQRPDSTYSCPGETDVDPVDAPIADQENSDESEASNWDYAEDYYGVQDGSKWSDRENPCTDAYFVYSQGIKEARNFLASNIGLTAKADRHGKFLIAATDLRTSKALPGVKLDLKNYQNRSVGTITTDANGLANVTPSATPYAVFAEKEGERGYLKVSAGTALPVSHFDTGGEIVMGGLKGIIYGERGVWRPGDSIYLTFVLQDLEKRMPADHPVTLELYNPRGQRVQSVTNAKPVNGFYSFTLATDPDAPTGDWTAKAILGGATITKTLKIETVMPNRLKVELDVGDGTLKTHEPVHAKISSQWLTGAAADSLDADVSLRLTATPTRFDRYADFVFDDPARQMKAQTGTIFTGKLDAEGRVAFDATIEPSSPPPGLLTANFTSRVFERGGAFSINHSSAPYAPYERFIGIKLPKGDVARGMLQTDTKHTVEIASLTADGKPVSVNKVRVTLYQVEWRWWWDQSGESLAQYAQASQSSAIKEDVIETKDGKGSWEFQVLYPQWGRYLIRACDEGGGHCTGQTVYIDWPSWAGRRQEQSGPAASALTLTANKDQFKVGDTATIQLPQASEGRALMTVETGTSILSARWLELSAKATTFTVPITREMSPNAYVSVTLIQPHENKDNDRPIRLYGVIPLKVDDPATNLKPVIRVAKEWKPESNVSIEVAESSGHDMTYTLAVVDEGLLGLTSYKTPSLHDHFYKREALGVSTWDLFDDVVGAYGAQIERLLALGGSNKQEGANPDERQSRFPPVVKVLGPFTLKAGLTGKHEVKLPPYVGAVRVMLVAGNSGAYGSAEKSVFVRQPLMLLPTLPRVIGPTEEAAVPVSLFVMDDSIHDVTLKAETDSLLQLQGGDSVSVHFDRMGDKVGLLKVKAAPRVGRSRIRFTATSGKHAAHAEVVIEVRSPNPPTTNSTSAQIKAGERWETKLIPHGLAGTNTVTLEVSAVPPLGLNRRLDYLIQYPYGCLEQTTSSVFPQLYLPALVKLEDSRRQQVETNVRTGIQRLRGFQLPSGAFTYWPGGFFGGINDARGGWATNYAGHFLIEAEKLGYTVPPDMMKDFLRYQTSAASAWTAGGATPALEQAYRLYTLALANQAEIGAMNRLRETSNLNTSGRWMLAAAYKLAGMKNVSDDLTRGMAIAPVGPRELDEIFSSELRDSAIVLTSAVVLGRTNESKALADELSAQLASDNWHSTQSIAYSLMAISKYIGGGTMGDFTYKRGAQTVTSTSPIQSEVLRNFPDSGAPIAIENTSQRTLFVTLFDRGVPAAGTDDAKSSGFSLDIHYTDAAGAPIDITRVPQGTDLVAEVSIRNLTQHRIDNIAFAQLVPAGWEIENERLAGGDPNGTRVEDEKRPPGAFWITEGSPSATAARAEYVDIRDDRIYRYFSLKADEQIYFRTRLNAAYRGHYYLPSVSVEAMYDATKVARSQGQWIDVTAKEH